MGLLIDLINPKGSRYIKESKRKRYVICPKMSISIIVVIPYMNRCIVLEEVAIKIGMCP